MPPAAEPLKTPPKETTPPAQKLPMGDKETNLLPNSPPANINLTTPAERIETETKNPF
jgi:hypothetical protein